MDPMTRKTLTSFTAIVLTTAFGVSSSTRAEQPVSNRLVLTNVIHSTGINPTSVKSSSIGDLSNQVTDDIQLLQPQSPFDRKSTKVSGQDEFVIANVQKIGETRSQTSSTGEPTTIARVYAHQSHGRTAVTLYLRNLPIVTFLGDRVLPPTPLSSTSKTQPGVSSTAVKPSNVANEQPYLNLNTRYSNSDSQGTGISNLNSSSIQQSSDRKVASSRENSTHPLWQASELAAKLNQFSRDQIDANKITVKWNNALNRYVIQFDNDPLIPFTSKVIVPNSTRNQEVDVLQATNRLRRLLGDAPPLTGIEGRQSPGVQGYALGPVRFRFNGMASWYGPGFHGNFTANGEVYNQNQMTAAHRHLPFGTRVRVTNLDNGRSVIVRINDRGPFVGNRVIDLSAGAARFIGLIASGIAPVRLEVLGQ